MCVRSKAKKTIRLMVCVGLLCLELSLIIGFYILPQFQARIAPVGHWEMETPLVVARSNRIPWTPRAGQYWPNYYDLAISQETQNQRLRPLNLDIR
jgi:hypothetical protein